jgi:hypothetical protein
LGKKYLFRRKRGFVVEIKCKISEIFGAEKVWNSVVTDWQFLQLEADISDILGQGLMTWGT